MLIRSSGSLSRRSRLLSSSAFSGSSPLSRFIKYAYFEQTIRSVQTIARMETFLTGKSTSRRAQRATIPAGPAFPPSYFTASCQALPLRLPCCSLPPIPSPRRHRPGGLAHDHRHVHLSLHRPAATRLATSVARSQRLSYGSA